MLLHARMWCMFLYLKCMTLLLNEAPMYAIFLDIFLYQRLIINMERDRRYCLPSVAIFGNRRLNYLYLVPYMEEPAGPLATENYRN